MSALTGMLSSPLAVPLGISLLVSTLCLRAIVKYRSLRQFRGPFWAKTSRWWLFWQSLRARVNTAQFEALQQYGNCETRQPYNREILNVNVHPQDRHVALVPIC